MLHHDILAISPSPIYISNQSRKKINSDLFLSSSPVEINRLRADIAYLIEISGRTFG